MKIKKIAVYLIMALVICLNINCVCNADDRYDIRETQEFTDSEGNKYKLSVQNEDFYIMAPEKDIIIKEIIIPEGLKYGLISYTRAEKIYIPSTAEDVSFSLNAADEIIIDEDNKVYCSVDGVVYSNDMKELLGYPQYKKDKVYKAPDSVEQLVIAWMLREPEYLQGFVFPKSLKEFNWSSMSMDVNFYIPSDADGFSEYGWDGYVSHLKDYYNYDNPKIVYTETDSPYMERYNSESIWLPVTGDENYNLRHAVMALKMSLGIYDTQIDLREYANTENSRLLFDENGNGEVDLDDAKVVLSKALGIK